MVTAHGSIAWFEVGSDDMAGMERFYGELFGWRSTSDDSEYRVITTGEGHPLQGGFFDTGSTLPNYAVFCVAVDDVETTCAKAADLGGKILVPPTTPEGGPTFAHLQDSSGNHFGIFTPTD